MDSCIPCKGVSFIDSVLSFCSWVMTLFTITYKWANISKLPNMTFAKFSRFLGDVDCGSYAKFWENLLMVFRGRVGKFSFNPNFLPTGELVLPNFFLLWVFIVLISAKFDVPTINTGGKEVVELFLFLRATAYATARICYGNSVCLSVRLSVCHTSGSVKNG